MNFLLRCLVVMAICGLARSISESFNSGYITAFVVLFFLRSTRPAPKIDGEIEVEKK